MPKLIGEGCSGKVYQDKEMVIKIFKNKRTYQHEKSIMEKIKKDKIYNSINMISYDDGEQSIKMPYIPHNLENICVKQKTTFKLDDFDIDLLIMELLLILLDLHNNKIVHGDYKAKNIQIDNNMKPYIIDFDLSSINFLSETDFKEKKIGDLHKMKLLIIQLIFHIDYPSTYTKFKSHLKNIEKNSPQLKKLLSSKEYNLDELIQYFKKE